MRQGSTLNSSPTPISMALSGQANGKKPYWGWDYKDFAPRLAFAYSPHADNGFLHALFGSAGKSSIRGGYGIYFDHFGEGIVNSFDKNGSFGLTTQLVNPAGTQDVDCTPRLTSLSVLPPANTDYLRPTGRRPAPAPFPGRSPLPQVLMQDPSPSTGAWTISSRLPTHMCRLLDHP